MKKLAILVLAAGKSSRFGNDTKQLLKYKDESLLELAVKKAKKISNNVFVILGHDKENCQKVIENLDVNIVYNNDFEKGIGNSISFGIKKTKDFEYTLIMLCDQPFIPLEHYKKLVQSINEKKIVTSLYANSSTVPAVFPKKYYEKLLKLDGDRGAKSILKNEPCINIPLEKKYSIDIDTKDDANQLLAT